MGDKNGSSTVIGSQMEFTLDKLIFSKNGFTIARVFSKSSQIRDMLNQIYGNISIKGNTPTLKPGIVYLATITNVEENNYGFTLSVDMVVPRDFNSDDIKTDRDMLNFIEVFIGEGTASKLREVKGLCKMIQDKDIDSLVKIKGIGEKIARKLVDVYETDAIGSKYMVKLKKMGFTDTEIKKLTDTYGKNLMTSYDIIKENIFSLVTNANFQLGRMDNIYLESLNGKRTDKKRINAYIWKGLKEAMYDGYKSYITVKEFYKIEIIENISLNVGEEILQDCIKTLINEKQIKIIDDKFITTFSEYKLENDLMELIHEILSHEAETLPIVDIDKDISEQEEIIGFKLNEGQREAVKEIVLTNKSICMLNGFGGTGKTTVTKVILNIYKKYNRDIFRLCALSGRASSVLGESSGYKEYSNTIHRTLGSGINEGRTWKYDYTHKFENGDVLILDEISMVDYWLLYGILAPYRSGMKIILLGDRGQLPSLNFGDTIKTMDMFDIQKNNLTQVMRQSEDAYILKVANDVRQSKNPFKKEMYKWYGEDVEVCIGDSYNYMIDEFMKCYDKNPNNSIVVTTTKSKVDRVNFDIQDRLIDGGYVKADKNNCIIKPSNTSGKAYRLYKGNHIMIMKNNYNCKLYENKEDFYEDEAFDGLDSKIEEVSVFNGEIYRIKDIFDKYVVLTDEKIDIIAEYDNIECSLAYGATVHKMQGSSVDNVFVYHNSEWVDTNMMVSKQWLYTAYTRARKRLSLHTDEHKNLSVGVRKDGTAEKRTIIEYLMNN